MANREDVVHDRTVSVDDKKVAVKRSTSFGTTKILLDIVYGLVVNKKDFL